MTTHPNTGPAGQQPLRVALTLEQAIALITAATNCERTDAIFQRVLPEAKIALAAAVDQCDPDFALRDLIITGWDAERIMGRAGL